METIIAGLLEQFEDGRLTRRQLITSLALAAAAGPAAAAQEALPKASSMPPPAAPAPWKTVWLDHISYAVADYRKSAAFYRDLMGWEIKGEANNQCTLKIGDIGEIIIRNRREPDGGSQASQSGRPPVTGVINHISYGVQPWDTDRVKTELERRGLNPRPDMVGDNFKSFHVRDPDGWDLQISNQTKDTRG